MRHLAAEEHQAQPGRPPQAALVVVLSQVGQASPWALHLPSEEHQAQPGRPPQAALVAVLLQVGQA